MPTVNLKRLSAAAFQQRMGPVVCTVPTTACYPPNLWYQLAPGEVWTLVLAPKLAMTLSYGNCLGFSYNVGFLTLWNYFPRAFCTALERNHKCPTHPHLSHLTVYDLRLCKLYEEWPVFFTLCHHHSTALHVWCSSWHIWGQVGSIGINPGVMPIPNTCQRIWLPCVSLFVPGSLIKISASQCPILTSFLL